MKRKSRYSRDRRPPRRKFLGKFEDTEVRDIAKNSAGIVGMLRAHTSIRPSSIIADIGAGTGLMLSPLSALVPEGVVAACEVRGVALDPSRQQATACPAETLCARRTAAGPRFPRMDGRSHRE